MAKKPSKKSSYVIVASNVLPATVIPGTNVVAEAAYRNDRHPHGPGPWDGEPDKIAWTDRATGYPCVIVRERGGEYGAHVGVPPDHSLSGYNADAVPGPISQGLHRPVSCAQACQRRVPEPVSICHVSERNAHFSQQMARGQESEDDAWWLGMLFDGPRDLVPMGRERKLAAERGEAYRDARFAYEQATLLARRLYEWDAKSDGSPPILRSSEEGDGQ